MTKRVGLKDIATELALDVSTVSRALSRNPRVNQATIARVESAAKRLGYRPNATARSLRSGRTDRVAVLLSPPQRRFASPIFLELLATLDQHLRGVDKLLTVVSARQRDEELDLVRGIVEDRTADAIVLGRTRADDPRVAYLLDQGFPFVTMGRTPWPDRHPWVDIDYGRAGEIAVEALTASSPEMLTIIAGPVGLFFAEHYLAGALTAAQRAGFKAPTVLRAEITEEAGEEIGRRILPGMPHHAIAAIQDSIAFGLYRAAASLNIAVGRSVAVYGGQNFPGAEHAAPALSTFSTSDADVADLLTRLLIARLEQGPEGPFETHMITPVALPRQSHLLADS